jgi:two-component system, OmpR family, sensor kinase
MAGRTTKPAACEDLQEAIRARDEFLSIAAHELRNPMHALALEASGALRAARRGGDAVTVTRLERMVLAINRYVQRANVLLDVSRINAGKLPLNPEPVDLARVVRESVEAYEAEAAHHRVELNVDCPDSLVGNWDRTALEQIASNLISNAIKFGAGHPVDVALDMSDDAARLTVRDRGVGISETDRRRIFERFEQVRNGEKRAGFGIGLWLVRSVVEAHGGSIAVESTLGRGSTFEVRLPLDAK